MPCPDLIAPPRARARLPCRVPAPAQTRLWYTAQPANLVHSLTGTNRHEITPRARQLYSASQVIAHPLPHGRGSAADSEPRASASGLEPSAGINGAVYNLMRNGWRYQSTTEPSSGSNRGLYGLGSPTCALSLSSSIVIPRPGSVSSGRCPFRTGGKGLARRFAYSASPFS